MMAFRDRIKDICEKIPRYTGYTLILLVITRLVLSVIGMCSRTILDPITGYNKDWIYSKHLWLDIWGVWDTGWYLSIASKGYSTALNEFGQASYGFFPLYPFLMKMLAYPLPLDPDKYFHCYFSGLVVSNVALFLSCIAIYKLVKLENDHDTALNSIKYLLLFPSGFILSGVLSESVCALFLILSFLFAKKNKWFLAGIFGFLLSLTRPVGVLAFFPLLYEYMKDAGWKPKNIRFDIGFLLLVPLGLLVFEIYTYHLTDMFYAYGHVKKIGWGLVLSNPFYVLYQGITGEGRDIFNSLAAVFALVTLSLFWKKIGFSYWLLGVLLIFLPLLNGMAALSGMMRYLVVLFPFAVLCAKLSGNPRVDQILTVCLALVQGFLMAIWSSGLNWII